MSDPELLRALGRTLAHKVEKKIEKFAETGLQERCSGPSTTRSKLLPTTWTVAAGSRLGTMIPRIKGPYRLITGRTSSTLSAPSLTWRLPTAGPLPAWRLAAQDA